MIASTSVHADESRDATIGARDESQPTTLTTTTGAQAPMPRAPTGTFEIGAAFSPDDGLIARTMVAQTDLFHGGQGLSLSVEVSKLHGGFAIRHDLPLGEGVGLRTELFATEHDLIGFTRRGAGGSFELGKRLGDAVRVFARYRLESVTLAPPDEMIARRTTLAPIAGTGLVATLGAGLSYDTRDGRGLHGSHLELFVESSNPYLGSESRFVRVRGVAETARALGPFTLRLHAHAGLVRSPDAMGVPLSERLFHDGHADVRGYALGTVGSSRGEDAEAIGHVELELPIWRRAGLSIATFVDAGVRYNFDPSAGASGSTLVRSVGASLIWRSPIGPLRLDLALPLDGDRRERQVLFSAGLGF